MRLKKVLTATLLSAALAVPFIPHYVTYCSDLTLGTDTSLTDQKTITSKFTVDYNILGYSVNVTIPDNADLAYDGSSTMTATKSITASGTIPDTKVVVISAPQSLEYALKNSTSVKVAGILSFGTTADGVCKETWTSDEVLAVSGTSKEFKPTVKVSDIPRIGDYTSDITFSVSIVDK